MALRNKIILDGSVLAFSDTVEILDMADRARGALLETIKYIGERREFKVYYNSKTSNIYISIIRTPASEIEEAKP